MDPICDRCKTLLNLCTSFELMYMQFAEPDPEDTERLRVYNETAELREAARLLLGRHMEREHGGGRDTISQKRR